MSENTKSWLKTLGPYLFAMLMSWLALILATNDTRTVVQDHGKGSSAIVNDISRDVINIKRRLGDL
jgi:hypothetical protein